MVKCMRFSLPYLPEKEPYDSPCLQDCDPETLKLCCYWWAKDMVTDRKVPVVPAWKHQPLGEKTC